MMIDDILGQWAADNLPGFVLLVIIFIAALVFLVWWARGVMEKVKQVDNMPCSDHDGAIRKLAEEQQKVSISVSKLACNEHKETEKELIREFRTLFTNEAAHFAELSSAITFLQKNIDLMTQMQTREQPPHSAFLQSKSPLTITTEGFAMVNKLGIDEMLDRNWERISSFVDENTGSKNPYDIQQFCMKHVVVCPEKFLAPEELDSLKMEAFNEGRPLILYLYVLAILIRDRYFIEHGINVSDVDKHDPNLEEKALY